MRKKLIVLLILVALGAVGFFTLNGYIYNKKQGGVGDYRSVTVVIDGRPVTIGTEGTLFFGNEAKGDVNDDGIPDLGFIFTQNSGGSGTFYYAVVALQNEEGRYTGTNAVFLGDRIAPQSSEIRNEIFIVNYADRKHDEPMTAAPSVGVTVYLYYTDALKAEWPVQLFYYNPDRDTDAAGNLLCSERGLVPVSRMMPGADVATVIQTLISGALTDAEKARGVTTEFPLAELTLTGAEEANGLLTLTFDDPGHVTTGGSCRTTILRAQIERTAKEFSGVSNIRIVPTELFQP